jgi:hypothetical protein
MQINPLSSMYSRQTSSSQQTTTAGSNFSLTDQIVDVPGATPRSALQLAGGDILLLPTPANAALMAEQAGAMLREKMQKAGIPLSPDFTVQQSGQPPVLKVAGGRQDAAAIETMINNDPALSRALHNASAVASLLPELAAASEVSEALQAAGSDAERRAIWDYHQARMATLRSDVRLEMRQGQMSLWVNGEQQMKYSA